MFLPLHFRGRVKSTTTNDIEGVYDGDSKILIAYSSLIENVDTDVNGLSNQIVS